MKERRIFSGKFIFILLDNYNKRMQKLRKVESIYEFYQREFADKTFSDDWWIRTAMKEAREKAEISKYAFESYKNQVYGDGECPAYFYGREVIPDSLTGLS